MQKTSNTSRSSGKTINSLVSADTVKFELAFLHPKYWALWLLAGLLWITTQVLPYRWQLALGRKLGRLLMLIASSRRKIAERNLELCFPEIPDDERRELLVKNFESTGIALFELAMAWWWSDRRLSKLLTFKGLEHIEQAHKEGRGVLLFSLHSLTLEIGVRLFGLKSDGLGVYRPHNNPVMEYLQVRGRSRSNKGMINKFKLKSAIRALRQGELVWYTTDQDFGRDGAEFVPFFAVEEAATITGSSTMCRISKAKMMSFLATRNEDGSGYTLEISEPLEDFPSGDDRADAIRCNKIIEQGILKAPEQYMWLHRRFKTRPNPDDPGLYGQKPGYDDISATVS
ncbi:LpxL/LpxP family Kdo(2)-lipid IV(A) lauroyl/palmitoleoyl acyltransferase [Endozoicomonas gorgoniicola]|uniref:Lipid A biosynthesis acyltransferase n=1 Tax=Endozoicomonas gorgoniicola TaxID=1234144 RepID=A0ABT3MXP0_9GAMM|nr:LpxL/LpxP family Kdo(2)-lipid IV(A) lauroyl/palmitoleoyl acyltransferase [Endozoicomonas gorgoniicola]MCW7554148.1 LpxL/LpxP family Kdo(2)-lipid IV(A) lauroyl/palmitoleoyl acyltransferase [Endozoicomonas gorgoniicola]